MQLRPSRDPSLAMTEHTPQALGSTTLEQGISSFSPGAMGQAHFRESAKQVEVMEDPPGITSHTARPMPKPRTAHVIQPEG